MQNASQDKSFWNIAAQIGVILLQLAFSLDILSFSVPDFCVLLYAEGRISLRAARGYLDRLRTSTSPALIQEAIAVVDEIGEKRGETECVW